MIKEELAKPVEKQSPHFLATLEEEISELEKIEKSLDESILGSFEKEDEFREKWLELVELGERFDSITR